MKSLRIIALILTFIAVFSFSDDNLLSRYPIIPLPNSIEPMDGEFVLDSSVRLTFCNQSRDAAKLFSNYISEAGIVLKTSDKGGSRYIKFSVDKSQKPLGQEGYELLITSESIVAKAFDAKGIFYAVQTLLQLMPPQIYSSDLSSLKQIQIPCVKIVDQTRFEWRGLHIDVVRHFMPLDFVKKYIDLMAIHKMNVLHFHLTDDQGWRIEIKKYPKLTVIGAWRGGTLVGYGHGKNRSTVYDDITHGGFYTQSQLRDLVQYASEKNITIVPEIEMPGHALAALAAYPEYSCTGGPHSVQMGWGIYDDIFCAGNEETFTFLENILDEVVDIFDSEYIHIGGDEAPKSQWKKCPKCQKRIEQEGLEDEEQLQGYLVRRIEKYLKTKGRTLIGWAEIFDGGIDTSAAVMSWRSVDKGVEAANKGHKVVMCPSKFCYLDYYQSEDTDSEPLAIGGFLPIEKTYSLDPVSDLISKENEKLVIGVQGNVWTEYIKTPQHLEYMAYPRACAVAEVAWTLPENKDEADFKNRLHTHLKRLDAIGVNYRKP